MYWITDKGVERLTYIIDNMNKYWSPGRSRELDLLGFMEAHGGGFSFDQIISKLGSRDIDTPLSGSGRDYERTLKSLARQGYISDLE